MAFLRAAWRFLMGVKDGLVLLFLLMFFGGLYAMLSMTAGERPAVTHKGALLLDLDGVVVEQPREQDPFSLLSGETSLREYRVRDIVTVLEAAKTDPHVKAVILDLDGFMGGGAVSLSRIGKALDTVRSSGKPVLAFATAYEDSGYRLAAHASEVWLNPIGGVAIMGPGGSRLYYKGLLDKLGVTAHIYRVGSFKSAVEPFLRSGQSPEAEQANRALTGALWQNWQDDVRKARPKAKLTAYVRDPVGAARVSRGDMARAAQVAGLVDHLGDEAAFGARVARIAGANRDPASGGYQAISFDSYARSKRPANSGAIGVLTVAGEIIDGEGGAGMAGGDSIAQLLRQTLAEQQLKALVIRIDSPGGSVLASEKIRSAIMEAKRAGLPVVASMGNVAASGGYWIATPADKIFAEPSTITGSIGVFGILPSFEGTLAKIGITSDGVQTTPLSGEPDVLGGVSPEFDAIAQMGVEDMYRRFVELVAKARNLSPQRVDSIAQGRVWDGGTARQIRLVDQFGGLEDAIAEAARLAKIDPDKASAYYIEPEPSPLAQFLERMRAEEDASVRPSRDLLGRQAWRQRQWALMAVADARSLTDGVGVRATCLECRVFDAPRVDIASAKQASGLLGWVRWLSAD